MLSERNRGECAIETEVRDLELAENGVQQLAGGAGVLARFGEAAEMVAEQQFQEVDEKGASLVAALAILRDHAIFVESVAHELDRVLAAAHEIQHALPVDFVVVVVRLLLVLPVQGAVGAGFLLHASQRSAAQEGVDAVNVRADAGGIDLAGLEPDLKGSMQRTQTVPHMLGPVKGEAVRRDADLGLPLLRIQLLEQIERKTAIPRPSAHGSENAARDDPVGAIGETGERIVSVTQGEPNHAEHDQRQQVRPAPVNRGR